ncbi:hypothetical protein [Streptomyces sp. 1114.5]|uniref:hypothetical protein n=1 Tax=Streptomyces sp. 1114.5 TaxID=1938830 RepID=UPI0016035037|nr:hypothetical protein [Streptomyces sp. 1114.5]
MITDLVPGSLRDGHEHAVDLAGFPESALPERELLPAEQVWSDLMDPKAAARLLDEET